MREHVREAELAVVAQTVQVEEVGDVDVSLAVLADGRRVGGTFRAVLNLERNKHDKVTNQQTTTATTHIRFVSIKHTNKT